MQPTVFDRLRSIGLRPIHQSHYLSLETDAPLARISAVDRGLCRAVVVSSQTDSSALSDSTPTDWGDELGEILVRPAKDVAVAVGDWVTLEGVVSEHPRVEQVLERSSLLSRSTSTERSHSQLIAANVDVVFVVVALTDTDKLTKRALNPRRIERYVVAIRDGGAEPVVVVNKSDLGSDERGLLELRARLHGTEVLVLSALTGDPVQELSLWAGPSDTVAFVGPSGVGKSTLSNALVGRDALATGTVREADTKGRHTTTRRLMLPTAGGAVLIDTPGMREFGLATEGGVDAGFADIAALAKDCQFADCRHEGEPGCAIQAAIEEGELSEDELHSYRTLQDEALRHAARRDAYSRHLVHAKDKRFAKMVRETMRAKRGRR